MALPSILAFRTADGFTRNVLFANQVDLFQKFGALGANGAQRAAKFLNAVSSLAPLAAAILTSRCSNHLGVLVVLGSGLEILGLLLVAASVLLGSLEDMGSDETILGFTASDLKHFGGVHFGSQLLMVGLFVVFATGFGLVTAALPVLANSCLDSPAERPRFMQKFFACLASGAMVGTAAAAVAQARKCYVSGLLVAVAVLAAGTMMLVLGLRTRELELSTGAAGLKATNAKSKHLKALELLPLLMLLPFYASYCQWTTAWYVQAEFLDRRIAGFDIPTCMLQAFERVAALVALVVMPRLWSESKKVDIKQWGASSRAFERQGLTPLLGTDATATVDTRAMDAASRLLRNRLAAGSLLAALALTSSAVAEVARRDWVARLPEDPEVSSLSVVYVLPQYLLIATAEALIYPAQTEFTSSSALLVGISLAVQASAAAGLGLLLGHLEAWIPDTTPNDGHYDKFFLVLAILSFAASVAFYFLPAKAWENTQDA